MVRPVTRRIGLAEGLAFPSFLRVMRTSASRAKVLFQIFIVVVVSVVAMRRRRGDAETLSDPTNEGGRAVMRGTMVLEAVLKGMHALLILVVMSVGSGELFVLLVDEEGRRGRAARRTSWWATRRARRSGSIARRRMRSITRRWRAVVVRRRRRAAMGWRASGLVVAGSRRVLEISVRVMVAVSVLALFLMLELRSVELLLILRVVAMRPARSFAAEGTTLHRLLLLKVTLRTTVEL